MTIKNQTMPVPTESVEQQALFRWADFQCCTYPELELMFHIPNGGSRRKAEAGIFKAEGVKAGVPDLYLPVARGKYHGMFVEMKRLKGSKTSDEQLHWLEQLTKQGYYCVICKGWEVAKDEILKYLNQIER